MAVALRVVNWDETGVKDWLVIEDDAGAHTRYERAERAAADPPFDLAAGIRMKIRLTDDDLGRVKEIKTSVELHPGKSGRPR